MNPGLKNSIFGEGPGVGKYSVNLSSSFDRWMIDGYENTFYHVEVCSQDSTTKEDGEW